MKGPEFKQEDLRQTVRLRNPLLYDAARKDTAKELPTGSRLFWKKTLEAYQKLGGRTELELEEPQ